MNLKLNLVAIFLLWVSLVSALIAGDWTDFKNKYGKQILVRYDHLLRKPGLIYGKGMNIKKPTEDNVVSQSLNFIKENGDLFGVSEIDIELKSMKQINDNYVVLFQQYHEGVPVEGGIIGISIAKSGIIKLIGSGSYPNITISTNSSIDKLSAIAIAKNQYSESEKAELKEATLVVLPIRLINDIQYFLTWKVKIFYHSQLSPSKVFYVDAQTGSLIRTENYLAEYGINGQVKGYVQLWRGGTGHPWDLVTFPNLKVRLSGSQYEDESKIIQAISGP